MTKPFTDDVLASSRTDEEDTVFGKLDPDVELSLRAVESVEILVQELHVDVDLAPSRFTTAFRKPKAQTDSVKPILKDVNAQFPPGTITAILGASGSGKTSLLNSLSHRIEGGRLKTRGQILYNGTSRLSIRSSYTMQEDVLLASLTVRETLRYAAELRLPPSVTAAERLNIVEEVIMELGLKDCANTKIGNKVHRGCSGGQRRRTSLAVQMLANPSVLFLDEVTTGLDASTAYQLVKTLKNLAEKGRTIIMTIHQPRSEIWSLFDNILLLAGKGSPLYCGSTQDCLPYFKHIEYELPAFVNPAEFLIDLSALDNRSSEAEATSSARIDELVLSWEKHLHDQPSQEKQFLNANDPASSPSLEPKETPSQAQRASFLRQCNVLTRRTFKLTWRDPYGLLGSMLQATMMSVISGWIFLSLDGSLQGIRSRQGALFLGTSLQPYLIMLYEIYRLTYDIQTFDRERGEGIINIPAWLLSRRIARFPLEDLPVPLTFSVIFYFMVGFRHNTTQFFIYFAIVFLMHHISVNVATLCVALRRDFAQASLIANSIFTIQSLAGGYFVQPNQIPVWTRWLHWTAYSFYGYAAFAVNEFLAHTPDIAGQLYDCPYPGGTSNSQCGQWTGTYIMRILEIPFSDLERPLIILLAFILAFFLGSGIALTVLKIRIGITRPHETDDTDFSAGKEVLAKHFIDPVRTITIRLEGFTLDIGRRSARFWKFEKLSILQHINSEFRPGGLNVIMGPSGSGKTSLLNLMARRLHDSAARRYVKMGRITFNGAEPSLKVLRSICSFVCQDDDQLLPCLTVRENLRFAAILRLPSHFSKPQKIERAEAVLLKLGLRDCANNIVGDETVKGISGGEKRRTTIAIQILTDPQILLLDEPTSGLDAFTASSIVEVLKGLANEGRTLVLTIHQTRSDLFKYFDTILLLAGGSVVYTGTGSEMLPHFATLGHECPTITNPADFALDLISVNLQSEAREERTREKVRSLILNWDCTKHSLDRKPSKIQTPAELGSFAREMTPLSIAFPALMQRSFINFKRNKAAIVARTSQVLAYSIILALLFSPLGTDLASINARLGFLQEITPLYFVGMLQNVAVYPKERDVFYREQDDNAYSVEAFFLQYTLGEVPFEIVGSLIAAILLDLATQLPRTATVYFVMAFNCFAIVNVGESLGIMFNTLFPHTGFAVNVMSVVISIPTLMAGTMSLNIPDFLQALNHLSPLKWSLGNLVPYSFRGVHFHCQDFQMLPSGECPTSTGEEVLKVYNFDTNPELNLLALGICVVVYRLAAYLVLKAARTRWDISHRFKTKFATKA